MRRTAAVIALVALAATAGGGSAQGDQGSFVSPLARDIDASASASALGDVPPETDAWSNAGAYWESGGDTPRHGAEDRTDVSSSDVYDAVKALGAVPYRQCFVVVKDGAIAHESYDERRGVDASTRLATDSVGIIATVALVGAATQRGLFRLDQPVMSYGVRGMRERFGAYAGLVTAHHLLSQTHGGGEASSARRPPRRRPRVPRDAVRAHRDNRGHERAGVRAGRARGAARAFERERLRRTERGWDDDRDAIVAVVAIVVVANDGL